MSKQKPKVYKIIRTVQEHFCIEAVSKKEALNILATRGCVPSRIDIKSETAILLK